MELQRCNHCGSVFDEELFECPICGKDDALAYPIDNAPTAPALTASAFEAWKVAFWKGAFHKSCRLGQHFCNILNLTDSELFYENDPTKCNEIIYRKYVKEAP